MTDNWLLSLEKIEADDLALAGAKALNLALLHKNKLLTPPGLVVTTAFFETQIAHYAYRPIWCGSPDVAVTEGALQFLADFLKTTPLAPPLDHALRDTIEKTFPPEITAFAVRSSAIEEDNSDRSFAGCHLTELGVPRSLLTVSLTRCWASALAGRAIQYRIRHGMSLQSIKIAVLIQPMLYPESAGVAFSLNPVTGSRDEMVVEAAATLGEAVVSGRINPYRYYLNRETYAVIKKEAGDVTHSVREPLSTPQLSQLAQTIEQIEALAGMPQDVEWAYQNNALYLLQTRPITATGSAVATLPHTFDSEPLFDTEWTRANHPDTLPDLPSPLFLSLMERMQDRGIKFFERVGLDVSGLGPYIKSFFGRPYLNLSMIKRVFTRLGLSPIPLLAMAGYLKADNLANPFNLDWEQVWRARTVYPALFSEALTLSQTVAAYEQMVDQLTYHLQTPADTPGRLLKQFKRRERVYGDLIGVGLVLLSTLTALTVLIARLIQPLFQSDADTFRMVGTLGKNPAAVRHNQTLLKLAHQAKTEPAALAYLTDPGDSFAGYTTALAGTHFLADFQTYLRDYGYRADYEPDMGYPRFAEQPQELLQTIAGYICLPPRQSDPSPADTVPISVWAAAATLFQSIQGWQRWFPWRQVVAMPALALLNKLFSLRHTIFTAEAQAMAVIRHWDLQIAAIWVQAGLLEQPEDYFWLTMAEIERALATNLDSTIPLKPAVVARKTAYQLYAPTKPPFVLQESQLVIQGLDDVTTPETASGTLVGLPVSPGQVQGIVEFLRDLDHLDQFPQGHILVVPSADPVYLPFFPLASGLIIERGGMLSHGSIVAREYGLPAVSNLVNARRQLTPGDRVLLDGSTGIVQILEKKESTHED